MDFLTIAAVLGALQGAPTGMHIMPMISKRFYLEKVMHLTSKVNGELKIIHTYDYCYIN